MQLTPWVISFGHRDYLLLSSSMNIEHSTHISVWMACLDAKDFIAVFLPFLPFLQFNLSA